jgi:precorrin-2 methylase
LPGGPGLAGQPLLPGVSASTALAATVYAAMTAKQRLRRLVDELSEVEAAEALDVLAAGRNRDSLRVLLDNTPQDDEPTTPEEDEGACEAREQIARGEVFSAEQIKREIA